MRRWSDWLSLLLAVGAIGALGAVGARDLVEGFFGSLRAFGIAVAILVAFVGGGALVGELIGRWAGGADGDAGMKGAIVGLILFALWAAAG